MNKKVCRRNILYVTLSLFYTFLFAFTAFALDYDLHLLGESNVFQAISRAILRMPVLHPTVANYLAVMSFGIGLIVAFIMVEVSYVKNQGLKVSRLVAAIIVGLVIGLVGTGSFASKLPFAKALTYVGQVFAVSLSIWFLVSMTVGVAIYMLVALFYSAYYAVKEPTPSTVQTVEKVVVKNEFDDEELEEEGNVKKIGVAEKEKFAVSFERLNVAQRKYYDEIVNYALDFENTNINNYDYDQRIRVGQRKTLALISIKQNTLVVKFKMGKLKVGNGLEPLKLKPIKITVRNDEDLENVKKQIETAYYKLTGVINVNYNDEK